ncbi:MAG: RNase P subunit p30 family protein [Candidatus Aenigmarchaeota archaeon]|nr:RNase P subunit p30 family protein [Candidatus Aenigmarchaeota archaeon]
MHVHSSFSGGESSLEQLASMAKQLGYRGICFTAYPISKREESILKAEIERVKKEAGIEILLGFEARNIKELKFLAKRRGEFDVLLARGGDLKLNREACETPEVDILTHPEFERLDSGLDHVSVKFAAKNNVAIEVNFREILISNKKTRSMILKNMSRNVKLAKKYHATIIICSGGISHYELRDPKVLISFANQLGLELKEAKEAISKTPESIVKKIKERRSENFIIPGVKVIE